MLARNSECPESMLDQVVEKSAQLRLTAPSTGVEKYRRGAVPLAGKVCGGKWCEIVRGGWLLGEEVLVPGVLISSLRA